MKKVLIAFDGTQFSEGAFEFARNLHQLEPILLVGVFVPQVSFANLWSYAGAMAGPSFVPLLEPESSQRLHDHIGRFEALCRQHHIPYRVHRDYYEFALPELKRETRFADLLLLSSEKFYENLLGDVANEYMKDALHAAECPVVVVPERFVFPTRNILAYDGSASCVYAIKQFAYLFPGFCSRDTLLVYAGQSEEDELPSHEYIQELTAQHFSRLSPMTLNGGGDNFRQWACAEADAILVSGSYGRSLFSQMVRKSFVSEVIAQHKLPVFITHR